MRKRLCRWLYRLGFTRTAYRVSTSICGHLVGRNIAAALRAGVGD